MFAREEKKFYQSIKKAIKPFFGYPCYNGIKAILKMSASRNNEYRPQSHSRQDVSR